MIFNVHFKELKDNEWEKFSEVVKAETPAKAATYISKKYPHAVITKVKKG